MKNGRVKNIVKKLITGLMITSTITTALSACDKNNKNFDSSLYNTTTQIEQIADNIDCDLSYMNMNLEYSHINFNTDGSPIKVNISNDYCESSKQSAIKALDYVFDTIHDINDKYSYELVDDEQNAQIKYVVADISNEDVNARAYTGQKRVVIDSDRNNESTNNNYSMLHETMHLFGYEDVYIYLYENNVNTDTYRLDTIMNNSKSYLIDDFDFYKITPNDYKCLLALYAPKINNNEEMNKYCELAKSKSDNFTNDYYTKFCKKVDENTNTQSLSSLDNTGLIAVNKQDKHLYIKIKNDKYIIYQTNNDGKILSQCNGYVKRCDNYTILLNAKFDKFYFVDIDAKFISDLLLKYDGNNASLSILTPDSCLATMQKVGLNTIDDHICQTENNLTT